MREKGGTFLTGLQLVATVTLVMTLSNCRGLAADNTPPPPAQGINQINHIIFMAQENRGFEHYFGALRQYWAANNFPDQSLDGLLQFNPASGAAPLLGPPPTNVGCDPAFPFPGSDCVVNANSPTITSFHMISMCVENPSPSWNEAHVDRNFAAPLTGPALMDGFVKTAAHDARTFQPPFHDSDGQRAMGYYDGGDLPYYYFMASSFGTSDRWFSPVMSRTAPNRMYSIAATSQGHVYPLHSGHLTATTIFDLLQTAGVSWKIYVTDLTYGHPIKQDSAINYFTAAAKYKQNIVPVSQFLTDAQNGTLPSVSYIDPGYNAGLDEHPSVNPNAPENLQKGAHYVSTLIDGLMQSPSWKDSAFILTFDEFGGFYDHVAPLTGAPFVSPDGIPPSDYLPNDLCTKPPQSGPICNFDYTGYRVPLIVISPFAKKNYVSHTPADYTAWLKFVETRFNLPSLTQRDTGQMDMTEFFDFVNVPWKVPPPNPPNQPTNGPCYLTSVP